MFRQYSSLSEGGTRQELILARVSSRKWSSILGIRFVCVATSSPKSLCVPEFGPSSHSVVPSIGVSFRVGGARLCLCANVADH